MTGLIMVLTIIFSSITMLTWWIVTRGVKLWAIYRERFTEALNSNLSEMFLFVDARKMFIYNGVALVGVPVVIYFITGLGLIAIVSGIGVFVFPKIMYRWLAKHRLRQFDLALPDTLSMIAGAMRAGASLPIAIEGMVRETAGPISQEFSLLLREQRIGVPLDQALENLGERVKSEDLALVLTAARIGRDVGGNIAEIFDRLSSTLRQKQSTEGKIAALTSQGKLQGWVVGMLPLGMIAVLYQMEPVAMKPLMTSLFGWMVLAVIVVLELMGIFMIRKIVAIDI